MPKIRQRNIKQIPKRVATLFAQLNRQGGQYKIKVLIGKQRATVTGRTRPKRKSFILS